MKVPRSNLQILKRFASYVLVPDTTGQFQRSCEVQASRGLAVLVAQVGPTLYLAGGLNVMLIRVISSCLMEFPPTAQKHVGGLAMVNDP